MSNQFSGVGNIGTDPQLHEVTVNGEERQVAEMRVYFDRCVPSNPISSEIKPAGRLLGFIVCNPFWPLPQAF